MTSVADLYADAVARMAEREHREYITPDTPPAVDLVGAMFALGNVMVQVVRYEGIVPGHRSRAERDTWIAECMRCGYELRKTTRAITSQGSRGRCPVCTEAGITSPPTLAEATAAHALRQRLVA